MNLRIRAVPRLGVLAALTSAITGFSCLSLPAHAFSKGNHEIVGLTAEQYMQQTMRGRRALDRVHAILGGENLGKAARWADDVKEFDTPSRFGQLPSLDEKRVFLQKVKTYYTQHPDELGEEARGEPLKGHRAWHYVNLPFQMQGGYSSTAFGRRDDDIVQNIRLCIRALQGTRQPGDIISLNDREAIRLLAHYVGDIHQPLHVGSGYVLSQGGGLRFVDPSFLSNPTAAKSDRGGNALEFDDLNLHSYWDRNAPDLARNRRRFATFAQDLVRDFPASSLIKPAGDISLWSTQWANNSLQEAKKAYDPLTIQRESGGNWLISAPDNYDLTSSEIARKQMANAGFNLAFVLTKIFG